METCVLLAARRYQFTDDKTGRPVEGVSLTYLTGDSETTPDQRGMFPLSITAPLEVFGLLTEVPGVYDMDFKQRPGKGGKPALQVVGLRFKQALTGLLGASGGSL
jgi:hypothetical protein